MIRRSSTFLTQRSIEFHGYKDTMEALGDPKFTFPSPEETILALSRYEKEVELNLVGAIIWDLLATPKSRTELTNQLQDIFDIDAKDLQTDVDDFLQVLTKFELIDNT